MPSGVYVRGQSLKDRLEGHLIPIPFAGCMIYDGGTNAFGHGKFKVNGKNVSPHRLAWELANGPIPAGRSVLHNCDVPSCCNVDHLYLGSYHDNAMDRTLRNRGRRVVRALPQGVDLLWYGRYKARVKFDGKTHYLGVFDTPEEAAKVAAGKRAQLHSDYLGRRGVA